MIPTDQLGTFEDLRAVLRDSVETSVRLTRAAGDPATNERDREDFPLVSPAYETAIPERVRPALRASAGRLRELAKTGNRLKADAAVSDEALALVDVMPRRWRLPKPDPAELAARIPR
jgi:hypothetical protein